MWRMRSQSVARDVVARDQNQTGTLQFLARTLLERSTLRPHQFGFV